MFTDLRYRYSDSAKPEHCAGEGDSQLKDASVTKIDPILPYYHYTNDVRQASF
jgi:hypothetical protein